MTLHSCAIFASRKFFSEGYRLAYGLSSVAQITPSEGGEMLRNEVAQWIGTGWRNRSEYSSGNDLEKQFNYRFV